MRTGEWWSGIDFQSIDCRGNDGPNIRDRANDDQSIGARVVDQNIHVQISVGQPSGMGSDAVLVASCRTGHCSENPCANGSRFDNSLDSRTESVDCTRSHSVDLDACHDRRSRDCCSTDLHDLRGRGSMVGWH